ncbi:hypothetical protein PENSPDRAFT_138359 [Peniophora sp. CONT]|nr:hypothetical protein PENSPDRAFT_138359 [Peniophora sp. CONT]
MVRLIDVDFVFRTAYIDLPSTRSSKGSWGSRWCIIVDQSVPRTHSDPRPQTPQAVRHPRQGHPFRSDATHPLLCILPPRPARPLGDQLPLAVRHGLRRVGRLGAATAGSNPRSASPTLRRIGNDNNTSSVYIDCLLRSPFTEDYPLLQYTGMLLYLRIHDLPGFTALPEALTNRLRTSLQLANYPDNSLARAPRM